MDISAKKEGKHATLEMSGALTTSTTDVFARQMDSILQDQIYTILLDCTQMDRISSAGFREMLKYLRTVRGHKGKIILCCVSTEVHRALEIAGMISAFEIHTTRASGEKALTS